MEAKSPVLTEEFVPDEIVFAKNQPEYLPLPVLRTKDGVVLSRWRLTDAERAAVADGADILLTVMTFNAPLQPFRIEVAEHPRSALEVAEEFGLI
mgnify:CR=1 FL=1